MAKTYQQLRLAGRLLAYDKYGSADGALARFLKGLALLLRVAPR